MKVGADTEVVTEEAEVVVTKEAEVVTEVVVTQEAEVETESIAEANSMAMGRRRSHYSTRQHRCRLPLPLLTVSTNVTANMCTELLL